LERACQLPYLHSRAFGDGAAAAIHGGMGGAYEAQELGWWRSESLASFFICGTAAAEILRNVDAKFDVTSGAGAGNLASQSR